MFCSQFDTNLALVPWTMPGDSMLIEQICGFSYSSIHTLLLSPCIKALAVAWFLFLRR